MAILSADSVPESAPTITRPHDGWQAKLHLHLAGIAGATRIVERKHEGPLVVQRPFYPEGQDVCHTYLVHSPGGIVGGDILRIRLDATDAGHALVTTPAATRLYRSAGPTALLDQKLTVSDSSTLEWLPQETIAFEGSRSEVRTQVVLEEGARFIGWDVLSLGRPAAGESFERGALNQRLEVRRAGVPLIEERLALTGSGPELQAAWGMAGHSVIGTLIAVHPDEVGADLIHRARGVLPAAPHLAAATQVSGALVVRLLADGARDVLRALGDVWAAIRPALLGRRAEPPRIWAT
jgi:urease accessory protein